MSQIIKGSSFIRGFHEYMAIWEPNIGDEHDLKREPGNKEDINAVAVVRMKDEYRLSSKRNKTEHNAHPNELTSNLEVVGHVPKLMAQWVTRFLKGQTNSATVVVKGKRINRGAGYGLELPCQYHFKGDTFSCDWLKEKLQQGPFEVDDD